MSIEPSVLHRAARVSPQIFNRFSPSIYVVKFVNCIPSFSQGWHLWGPSRTIGMNIKLPNKYLNSPYQLLNFSFSLDHNETLKTIINKLYLKITEIFLLLVSCCRGVYYIPVIMRSSTTSFLVGNLRRRKLSTASLMISLRSNST